MASQLFGGWSPSKLELVGRVVGWTIVFSLGAFLINTVLQFGLGWPSLFQPDGSISLMSLAVQSGTYLLALALAIIFVSRHRRETLRTDADKVSAFSNYLVSALFWGVLLVGLVDMSIAFLRVEDLLAAVTGSDLSQSLARSDFRGLNVHLPLFVAGCLIAIWLRRSVVVAWLVLAVFLSELSIVFSRFVFSYEQAFQSDLVRFWYSALFLLGSAYTLKKDGHVRVDILYASFSRRKRGLFDATGAMLFGMMFCWMILILGLGTANALISGPLLRFDIAQAGYGMYIKYLLAGLLGAFAITMIVELAAQFMRAAADFIDPEPTDAVSHSAQEIAET